MIDFDSLGALNFDIFFAAHFPHYWFALRHERKTDAFEFCCWCICLLNRQRMLRWIPDLLWTMYGLLFKSLRTASYPNWRLLPPELIILMKRLIVSRPIKCASTWRRRRRRWKKMSSYNNGLSTRKKLSGDNWILYSLRFLRKASSWKRTKVFRVIRENWLCGKILTKLSSRLGKPKPGRNRLLKVEFNEESLRNSVLFSQKKLREDSECIRSSFCEQGLLALHKKWSETPSWRVERRQKKRCIWPNM